MVRLLLHLSLQIDTLHSVFGMPNRNLAFSASPSPTLGFLSPTPPPRTKLSESQSLVLVINDTKLLMLCVKCFELGISNTCDDDICGKEWWPQDHKEMVHGHEMMIMVIKHEEIVMEQSDQGKGIILGFAFDGLR
jgi:hypothetical protein